MEHSDFEKLGMRWEWLNTEYDFKIQSFLKDPSIKFSHDEILNLKAMQQELYDLEKQWFSIVENLKN